MMIGGKVWFWLPDEYDPGSGDSVTVQLWSHGTFQVSVVCSAPSWTVSDPNAICLTLTVNLNSNPFPNLMYYLIVWGTFVLSLISCAA